MSLPELLSMFGLRAQTFSPALVDKHIDGHGHDSVLTPLGVLLSVKLPPPTPLKLLGDTHQRPQIPIREKGNEWVQWGCRGGGGGGVLVDVYNMLVTGG